MSTSLRNFNALNGLELKKVILKEIERHLDADFHFRNNVAYPQIAWRFVLAANIYPGEPSTFEVKIGVDNPIVLKSPEISLLPLDAPHDEVDIRGGSDITAPASGGITADAARRGADLPVPHPQTVGGVDGARITVDVPTVAPEGNATKPAQAGQTVEANVGKEGKIFARSVSLRTAANPTGLNAPEQHGSKPGIEDIQRGMDRDAEADRKAAE